MDLMSIRRGLMSQMAVVTLERADGRQIMRESIGAFPDMTPVPEPTEPEEVSEE